MTDHPDSELLQEVACSTFRHIPAGKGIKASETARHIVLAMERHPHSAYIQFEASHALLKLAKRPKVTNVLREANTQRVLNAAKKEYKEHVAPLINEIDQIISRS